ncbi:hypothetical protein JOM56_012456 [Amanita muscaria]
MYSEQDLETAIQNAVARREAELRADFTQREAYYIQREEAFKARIKEMSEAWKKDVQLRIQELEAEEHGRSTRSRVARDRKIDKERSMPTPKAATATAPATITALPSHRNTRITSNVRLRSPLIRHSMSVGNPSNYKCILLPVP